MKSKVWLSSPHLGGNELKYIKEAFAANWVAPLGPNVDGFEQDLELFLNEDVKVAALSAGTAAYRARSHWTRYKGSRRRDARDTSSRPPA